MLENQFSRTAMGAALLRAAHQTLEKGAIFQDPFACAILGLTPEQAAEAAPKDEAGQRMRLFIALRARFAEGRLAAAVGRGVRQAVVLGAGLDTFGLRNPFAQQGLRVFEVDHPDTQEWKRARLAEMGAAPSETLAFVAVDFTRDDLMERLTASGFDPQSSAFFMWLGVTPYLSNETTFATLAAIARIGGAEVAFDYTEELARQEGEARDFHDSLLERVAAVGEPIIGALDPRELADRLAAMGMSEQEDLGMNEIRRRFFNAPPDEVRRTSAGHLFWARRPGNSC